MVNIFISSTIIYYQYSYMSASKFNDCLLFKVDFFNSSSRFVICDIHVCAGLGTSEERGSSCRRQMLGLCRRPRWHLLVAPLTCYSGAVWHRLQIARVISSPLVILSLSNDALCFPAQQHLPQFWSILVCNLAS